MRMPTRVGLILAGLPGLSDIAILFALLGDGDHPPAGIVIISVITGLLTLAAIPSAWAGPTRWVMIVIVVTRLVSGLGDLAGLGEDAAVVTISILFLLATLACLYLLRGYFKAFRPAK